MKKFHILALCLLSLVVSISSCSRSENTGEKVEEAGYEVTAADSAQIIASTDEIMNLFKDGEIEDAAALLSVFNRTDSTLSSLSEEEVQTLRNRQNIFPVKAFEILSTDYVDPYDNTVVYNVYFSTDSVGVVNRDMKTKMAFNLIHIDGAFIPTLKDR